MFGNDFIFSVSRDFVRECTIPMLLMPGDDVVHPAEVSADLLHAPNMEVTCTLEGRAAQGRRDAPGPRVPDSKSTCMKAADR